jgi:hypothetical protein
MVTQLQFPQDFVLPPELPQIPKIDGLDHIYILTIRSKYPARYDYAQKWVQNSEQPITIWEGTPINQLTEADRKFVDLSRGTRDKVGIPDANELKRFQAVSKDHYNIWKQCKERGYKRVLILEDDAVLARDFACRLKELIKTDVDLIFLSDALDWHIGPHRPFIGPGLFLAEECKSRCADSYVMNKYAIETLVEHLEPFGSKMFWPVDHFLHRAAMYYNFYVAWAEPTISSQGSMKGVIF